MRTEVEVEKGTVDGGVVKFVFTASPVRDKMQGLDIEGERSVRK